SKGFALGASDYLVKPVNPPIVLARVKTHLVIHDQVNLLANQIEMRTKQLELSNIELSEMRSTLYSIADAVISLDINNCVLLMNPVAEKLTGWSESEAHGKLLEEVFCIVNDETRSKVDNPRGWVLNEGDAKGMTTHALLIAHDGTERSIGYSHSPIFDQDNNLLGDVLTFRDLTKEMEAEQAVINQLAIIETYGGLVALANMDGKLIYVNAGGIKMLGATQPDDILDKNITDFIEQTNLERETDELITAAAMDGAWNGEHRLKRINGTSIPVSKTIFIIPDAEGNPKHMGIIIMDISLQKELQEKLLVSEKLAVMGRILADVSHEINNPLAIVIGRTELILSSLDGQSTPFKAKLEVVLESARRCKKFLGYV
ncbi:MAG: PAS domain S-box protein, partial [Candidatus Methylumidiphilus sp.]